MLVQHTPRGDIRQGGVVVWYFDHMATKKMSLAQMKRMKSADAKYDKVLDKPKTAPRKAGKK